MLLLPLLTTLPFLSLSSALPTSSLSSPILPRAASLGAEVRSQIDVLNASVIELTAAVNAYDGSLLGVIPQSLAVISATAKVDGTTVKTAWLTQLSGNFTVDESQSVVTTLATLITPIRGSLEALGGKYDVFKKTLQVPVVLLSLKTLKKHTADLVEALGEKVTPDWAAILAFGAPLLDASFDEAIAIYSA
ncbi:unnamed protein product [Periconia digitata]|uniref:Antigenic cell wall galactomannoprotein n=1 Tax=Periconia digitata TaxID=1303443 RepID=A0A9W4UJN2_9PLEO|nr:unnamed protein product [Periconia digitata]